MCQMKSWRFPCVDIPQSGPQLQYLTRISWRFFPQTDQNFPYQKFPVLVHRHFLIPSCTRKFWSLTFLLLPSALSYFFRRSFLPVLRSKFPRLANLCVTVTFSRDFLTSKFYKSNPTDSSLSIVLTWMQQEVGGCFLGGCFQSFFFRKLPNLLFCCT